MKKLGGRYLGLLSVALAALVLSSAGAYLYLSSPARDGEAGRVLAADVSDADSGPQASRYITEYQVGGANSQPNAVASDSRGDIWFTLASDYAIGELDPANGTTHEFRIPDENGSLVSWGIAVDSDRGVVWFTDQLANSVWSFNTSSREFTRHPLATPLSSPYQVALDGAGDAWFTEIDGGRIGEITSQGSLKEFTVPTTAQGTGTSLVGPAGIAMGKEGAVWFTEVYANCVGSFVNGTFSRYPLAGASSPTGIALDSTGEVWVTLHGGSDIAELDPATNSTEIISTSVPTGVESTLPYFVAVDAHGNVWFNEHYGNAIARFTPSNETLVEYEIPTKVESLGGISGALTIGLDPTGRAWFTEFYTGKVGVVDPSAGLDLRVSTRTTGNPPPSSSEPRTIAIPQGGDATVLVSVNGSSPSTLAHSQGAGPSLQVSFSPPGNDSASSYTSEMTVAAPMGAGPGGETEVAVTVSAVSPDLVCSQVIEVDL